MRVDADVSNKLTETMNNPSWSGSRGPDHRQSSPHCFKVLEISDLQDLLSSQGSSKADFTNVVTLKLPVNVEPQDKAFVAIEPSDDLVPQDDFEQFQEFIPSYIYGLMKSKRL